MTIPIRLNPFPNGFLAHCRYCGSLSGNLLPTPTCHAARIDCADCGKFLNWAPFWFAAERGIVEPSNQAIAEI